MAGSLLGCLLRPSRSAFLGQERRSTRNQGHTQRHYRPGATEACQDSSEHHDATHQDVSCSRRSVLAVSPALAAFVLSLPAQAAENKAVVRGLAKYIKKKQLDPLVTYVPLLLEARDQLIRTGRVMVQDAEAARGLLRSGPFSGLRDNVRAVGQYAGQASSQEQGDTLVGGFFTNLQDFDFVLFTAVRSKAEVAPEAKEKLDATITALDSLLATVPHDIMAEARDVVEVVEQAAADAGSVPPPVEQQQEPPPEGEHGAEQQQQ